MKIIRDPDYGYRRVDPLPSKQEIVDFYQKRYWESTKDAGLQRLMMNGKNRDNELAWLESTFYSDIAYLLKQYSTGKRILDVGCGSGELLSYLRGNDYPPVGLEPDIDRQKVALQQGLTVFNTTLEGYVNLDVLPDMTKQSNFNAILLINVLEHMIDPVETLKLVRGLLRPQGVVCIKVPNDFSPLQLVAQEYLGKEPWWIAVPEHLNYFDFQSLRSLLEQLGFEILYTQGDFPMEVFLFMEGKDYTDDREVGFPCHQDRIRFETTLPSPIRRKLYQVLGEAGIGRQCLMVARIRDE